MRIVNFFAAALALVFSLIAIAFMAMLGVVIAIVGNLFGRRPTPTRHPFSPPPSPASATRLDGDDVIDVVTTPAKD